MSKVTILGSGGWGLALALSAFAKGHEVIVWSPFQNEIDDLEKNREHKKLLPEIMIPIDIKLTCNLHDADGSDIIIMAVPSFAVRQTANKLKLLENIKIVVNVAKGIENDTLLTLSQVVKSELPAARVVVLSGPSHAEEVARNVPTTVVAASDDAEAAKFVQSALMSGCLRIYTNDDVLGVELGGALKNVIAVAAGILDGLSLGDNTRAALITRGLTEIARLGTKIGANEKTFKGLSGLGDLVVTCTSTHSRNHRFGEMVGNGASIEEALKKVGTVEGYHAALAAKRLADQYEVEMPICEQCYNVLYNNLNPSEALIRLMERPRKDEHELIWM